MPGSRRLTPTARCTSPFGGGRGRRRRRAVDLVDCILLRARRQSSCGRGGVDARPERTRPTASGRPRNIVTVRADRLHPGLHALRRARGGRRVGGSPRRSPAFALWMSYLISPHRQAGRLPRPLPRRDRPTSASSSTRSPTSSSCSRRCLLLLERGEVSRLGRLRHPGSRVSGERAAHGGGAQRRGHRRGPASARPRPP